MSAPVLELESLLIRIIADATSYIKEFKEVRKVSQQVLKEMGSVAEGTTAIAKAMDTTAASTKKAADSLALWGNTAKKVMLDVQAFSAQKMVGSFIPFSVKQNTAMASNLKAWASTLGGGSSLGSLMGQASSKGFYTPLKSSGMSQTQRGILAQLQYGPAAPGTVMGIGALRQSGLSAAIPGLGIGGILGGMAGSGLGAVGSGLRMVGNQLSQLRNLLPSASSGFHTLARSIAVVEVSLTAWGGLSLRAFGKFDDALVRVMARLRDWDQTSRSVFEKGVFGMASPISSTALIGGLDALSRSGLNAADKIKALAIAETFAVASGIPMAEATSKLSDIVWNLGLTTKSANEQFAAMTHLSDMLVGVAPIVGSSVEQMTEAMGPRLTAAMKHLNVSMEQGVVIQGLYALAGRKGAEAGEMAARALLSMSELSLKDFQAWNNLGLAIFDAQGKMLSMTQILTRFENKFRDFSPMMREAALVNAGFSIRTIQTLLPLLGQAQNAKYLTQIIALLGDTSKKTADMMRESFGNQMLRLWKSVTDVTIVIGKHLAPIVSWLADEVQVLTKWFMQLDPSLQKTMVWVAAIVAGFVALAPVIVFVASAFASILAVVLSLISVQGLILGVITAIIINSVHWGSIWETMFGSSGTLAGSITYFGARVRAFSAELTNNFGKAITYIRDLWMTSVDEMGKRIGLLGQIVVWQVKHALVEGNKDIWWMLDGGVEGTKKRQQNIQNNIANLKGQLFAPMEGLPQAPVFNKGKLTFQEKGMDFLNTIGNIPIFKAIGGLMKPFGKEGLLSSLIGKISPALNFEGGEGMGGVKGKGMSNFAQFSLTRHMLGGPAAELIEYQQYMSLEQIKIKLDILIGLTRKNEPIPGIGWN